MSGRACRGERRGECGAHHATRGEADARMRWGVGRGGVAVGGGTRHAIERCGCTVVESQRMRALRRGRAAGTCGMCFAQTSALHEARRVAARPVRDESMRARSRVAWCDWGIESYAVWAPRERRACPMRGSADGGAEQERRHDGTATGARWPAGRSSEVGRCRLCSMLCLVGRVGTPPARCGVLPPVLDLGLSVGPTCLMSLLIHGRSRSLASSRPSALRFPRFRSKGARLGLTYRYYHT